MSSKLLITALVASAVAFILGYLVYGMALSGYFSGEMTNPSVERAPEDMVWWAMILGHLSWGFILTYIIGKWAGISTAASGAKAGAMIGFFIGLAFNMINYGVMDLSSSTAGFVDSIVMAVIAGITGAVIGIMMGRGKE